METGKSVRDQLFDLFLDHLTEEDWADLSCTDLAFKAGVPVQEAFLAYRNRYSYVSELIRRIDRAMLESFDVSMAGEPARDRLFDVLMARFDAMQPYRPVVVSLTKAAKCDPMLMLHLMALSRLTGDWIMEIAQISSSGVVGFAKSRGALAAYGRAFLIWLDDDSDDLAKTMAMLDKTLKRGERALRRAEKFACALPKLRKRCRRGKSSRTAKNASDETADSVSDVSAVDDDGMQAAAT